MSASRVLPLLVAAAATLAALPASAGAVGMSPNYPRVIASTGTAAGVRLTRLQAIVRPSGTRVRVTVRAAGASTGGGHRMLLSVAACAQHPPKYTAMRPRCPASETRTSRFTITAAPFALTRTLTVPRPRGRTGAIRVRVVPTTRTQAPPTCRSGAGTFQLQAMCRQFSQTGELLLNGRTWAHRPGTAWGIVAAPPAGITLDRIGYNSRTAAWVATSATDVRVDTTQGYAGKPPARSARTRLLAGVQGVWRTSAAWGGQFASRPTVRVVELVAAVAGQRLFTLTVPVPAWTQTLP